ncbi:MAG: tellurite resistance/C4-dicarboxylate transporter family protein [Brevibacterium sp.]|uniref:tellurite resistance/C4-dicarboxylate transporter family protein n=1 Tax=Brevibacterium sp. TaxID=1701 RepID=UPI002648969B|nr:tellurite resistance/C4-dicarboxylate transporter family protein [Brevibacterium sp.]MDN5834168.1 tellurite resistance/C4-dicarboxylate transporter family protein [Brevibacterium sp.]MDN6134868.1 tellurite resistance/C4-dicarboxylate transporter family protein [Brevibacterium sp.]MDN6158511.1 tellurite resistance/C4-dicarboxylate transporter family protein [Brevibacterium sp.]MDN6176485.1 tellurite resistance/C4-dicarboxylate transporter family protein [Brevibacterium sp.]MDN6189104.1 tellu
MSNGETSLTHLQTRWGLSPGTVTPGCFASVMATGIMAVGAHFQGLMVLSTVLFWLAVILYIFFLTLIIWRACSHNADLRADLHNPSKAFGFFTFVAATNVLATALEGQSHFRIALVIFCIGLVAWLILGYLIPFSAVLSSSTSPILTNVNGTWFVCVVAAQSVAVAASGLKANLPTPAAEVSFGSVLAVIAVIAWSVGVSLYLACAVFVGMRALLHRIGPEDLDAPYWVMMGALAISVVAGSKILEGGASPIFAATTVIIAGASAIMWSISTWLIPALVLAGLWRHFRHRIPLGYSAKLWSMVFPLGMYSVASTNVGKVDGVPSISWIGSQWYWIALAAWAIVFCGMVWAFVRSTNARPSSSAAASG